jgi:hypothetical protein
MSETYLWNPVAWSNKFGWDLVAEKVELGQTCLVQEPDMSSKCYWNLTWNPNKPG